MTPPIGAVGGGASQPVDQPVAGESRLLSIVLGGLALAGWLLIAAALVGPPDLAAIGAVALLAVFVLGRLRYGRQYRHRYGTARSRTWQFIKRLVPVMAADVRTDLRQLGKAGDIHFYTEDGRGPFYRDGTPVMVSPKAPGLMMKLGGWGVLQGVRWLFLSVSWFPVRDGLQAVFPRLERLGEPAVGRQRDRPVASALVLLAGIAQLASWIGVVVGFATGAGQIAMLSILVLLGLNLIWRATYRLRGRVFEPRVKSPAGTEAWHEAHAGSFNRGCGGMIVGFVFPMRDAGRVGWKLARGS